ncbi:hypothetical protein AVEN_192718-1 [Araneus ventricosus]|uniref:Uncharacterized protein n=1 Tax=Araneus ventricosus TaxID=182803 RepID=A0A4Y2JNH9_ARAVE|nr:hypothetical protein AVEN_192718-1 [Araneus ventricosus]
MHLNLLEKSQVGSYLYSKTSIKEPPRDCPIPTCVLTSSYKNQALIPRESKLDFETAHSSCKISAAWTGPLSCNTPLISPLRSIKVPVETREDSSGMLGSSKNSTVGYRSTHCTSQGKMLEWTCEYDVLEGGSCSTLLCREVLFVPSSMPSEWTPSAI